MTKKQLASRGGFTLIELLIFSAIFSIISITFIAILISVARIQVRESASSEVNQQSQFLMQTIQRYIEESSAVFINETNYALDVNATSSQLILRMLPGADTTGNIGRTYIYLSSGKVYLKVGDTSDPQPLTTDRVNVTSLVFTKRAHTPGHDSVDVSLALSYNSTDLQKKFAQILQTSVARVNAATFDSDVLPTATVDNRKLGATGALWASINGTIIFDNTPTPSNVGIGISPSYPLDVNGTLRVQGSSIFTQQLSAFSVSINSSGVKPNCSNGVGGGTLWYDNSVGRLQICMDINGANNNVWRYVMATST